MNGAPAAPPQRRSKRDEASATSGSAERLNRATTVFPDRLLKLTKKRPLAAPGRVGPRRIDPAGKAVRDLSKLGGFNRAGYLEALENVMSQGLPLVCASRWSIGRKEHVNSVAKSAHLLLIADHSRNPCANFDGSADTRDPFELGRTESGGRVKPRSRRHVSLRRNSLPRALSDRWQIAKDDAELLLSVGGSPDNLAIAAGLAQERCAIR